MQEKICTADPADQDECARCKDYLPGITPHRRHKRHARIAGHCFHFFEYRRFVYLQPNVESDRHRQNAEDKGDPPTPYQKLITTDLQ
jgi:hypothetical protein